MSINFSHSFNIARMAWAWIVLTFNYVRNNQSFALTFTGCCEMADMEGHCSWQSPPFTGVSGKSQQTLHRTTSPLPHVWKLLLLSLSRHRPLRHLEGQSWLYGLARLALCCLTIAGRASWYPTSMLAMFCTKSLVLHSTSRATPRALYLKYQDYPFCIDK